MRHHAVTPPMGGMALPAIGDGRVIQMIHEFLVSFPDLLPEIRGMVGRGWIMATAAIPVVRGWMTETLDFPRTNAMADPAVVAEITIMRVIMTIRA